MQDQSSIIKKQQEQIQLMKKLATTSGFYMMYFKVLPKHNSNVAAFNELNDLYYEFFGEYKYSSYKSFQTATNRSKK